MPGEPTTLDEALQALSEWQTPFTEEQQKEHGILSHIKDPIQPHAILSELQRLHAESSLLKQQLAAYTIENAAWLREEITLKKQLHAAQATGEPSILQLRQLIIEPAVNREFMKLAASAERATKEASMLKEELRILHDPSKGSNKALASQVQQLEEILREYTSEEGKDAQIVQLERSLDMAQAQLEEMRKNYGLLEDHAHSLDDELEILQKEMFNLRRAAGQASSGAGQPSPSGGGFYPQQHVPPMSPPMQQYGGRGGGGWGGRGQFNQYPPPGGKRPRKY